MIDINSLNKRKKFVQVLGFSPKNNSKGVYQKKYNNKYILEIDFEKKIINYGKKIKLESKTTQNFSQEENWVILECVNRLLEKGYKPEDLILEKIFPTGHGHSGRLDVLVEKNKKAYLMIECKTFGNEFKKEFQNLNKNGGQLFTYFQQDRDVEYIILYSSKYEENKIQYVNEIIKIEDSYRETSNVKDFYERWSKVTTQNGLFDNWVNAYKFKSKALTLNQLKTITQTDSSFIFNRFLEILRHSVVSDKPNAFNKIFTLFLCKIVDENKNPDDQLDFQWIEGEDDDISFQKRLTDLYKKGMKELLSKEVTDISDDEFNTKYGALDEVTRKNILNEITKIRLQKNNEFAIKEVFDEETFKENAKVLKEVVQLLQIYKLRYAEKQQYLSDFFEQLLTTGLKQESGQFFTPVPVARFICRSIPLNKTIKTKLLTGNSNDLLPTIMDYAAGSGHFLTESMDEIQNIIQITDESKLKPQVKKNISAWKINPFVWAYDYIYGIEKDYRLVKTAKVGCYFHGDGVAQVIHSDGLGNFKHTKEYKNKLNENDKDFIQDNKEFDFVISNPPYSVSAFRTNFKDMNIAEKDFELYKYLTDQSSEIECLFVERTKQLLKDGGIAGIILPSSILSNTGIYTKTREILLKYFEIIGITELGSGTFMATGTSTVTLFLRRRNNYGWINIQNSIEKFSSELKDITVNGIENVFSKYVKFVYKTSSFKEYISIFQKNPTDSILKHEIYKEYQKIKLNKKEELNNKIIELEKEKLLYFILAYGQKTVLVKSGEKKIEKTFLGYEFSSRRGSEGIHPIQRGKLIDECTKLFDPKELNNPKKASTYIYDAFENNFDREIDGELKNHISRVDLLDMMTWDRVDFEKNISLNVKKKVKIESKWNLVRLGDVIFENQKSKIKVEEAKNDVTKNYLFFTSGENVYTFKNHLVDGENIFLSTGGNALINFYDKKASYSTDTYVIKSNLKDLKTKFLYYVLKSKINEINISYFKGVGLKHLQKNDFRDLKIPLPRKNIQDKIVKKFEELEENEFESKSKIENLKNLIISNFESLVFNKVDLGDIVSFKNGLNYNKDSLGDVINIIGVKDFQNNFVPNLNSLEKVQIGGKLNNDYVLNPGDILVVRSNGSANLVGRFLFVDTINPLTSFSGFTIRLRSNLEKVVPKYLCYFLKTNKIRNKLTKNSNGANIKSLNQTLLSSLKIPLPSINEQNKIVSKNEKIDKKISELENEIKKIFELKKKILKEYL